VGPFRIRIFPAGPHQGGPKHHPGPPTISGTPAASVSAGQPYSFKPAVTDPGHEGLSFAIVNRPAWATFNTATGELFGTPTTANEGTFANILISVAGDDTTVSLPAFAIQVLPTVNNAPTISGTPAATVLAGTHYSFTPVAADPDGNALTFSILNAPPWASFSASTGQLSGTPTSANVGTFTGILITVSDGTLKASLPAFSIQVQAPANDTLTISGIPAASVVAGSAYAFTPSASDPDGNALTFSVANRPSWAHFSSATGQLSGTPTSANVGTFTGIVIAVSDGNKTVSLPAFAIQVLPTANNAPTISGTPAATVLAGTHYSFTPVAADPDGNALTFSILNAPPWASFSSVTGQLSGTPATANVGPFTGILITVSDGTLKASLPAFSIQVQAPANDTLTISGIPAASVVAGSAYAFTPSATDTAGRALVFSVQAMPSWATFSASTGQLSGTPTSANVGTFTGIVITVSDGNKTVSLPAFTITVSAPATPPPTISGTPATSANAGTAYSFKPTASGPNGNVLIFSIENIPSWAAFNAQSGTLSGIPAAADAGTYANIVISVSDGTSSASLAAFNITVTQAASGSATLSWSAPTQNTDGTALTNLAGFHIYYGTSAANLNQSVQIANPGLTTYVLSNLAAGTWYVSINAYTTASVQSVASSIVSTTIP
jgi:Putative Ig domain